MNINPSSLRSSVFIVVVVMATLPVLLLSLFFVDRIYDLKNKAVESELAMHANQLTTQLSHELDVSVVRLQTMSNMSDVVLTTHSPLFSHRAYQHMQNFLADNPLVTSLYLLDYQKNVLEVAPTTANLISLPAPVSVHVDNFLNTRQLSNHVQIQRFVGSAFILQMMKLIDNATQDNATGVLNYYSDSYFVVFLPLYMTIGKSAVEKELKGALLAVIPQYRIAQRLKQLSDQDTQFDFYVQQKPTLKGVENDAPDLIMQKSILYLPDSTEALTVHFYELQQKYYQPVHEVLYKLFALVVLVILLVFTTAYWLARKISAPLNDLQSDLTHYAQGHYNLVLQTVPSFREIRQIYQVLEQMAKRVIQDHHDLENRVQQRTFELETTNQSLLSTMNKLQKTQEQLIQSEKMALLGQLVAGVAHEINTPVGISVTAASYVIDSFKELSAEVEAGTLSKKRLALHMDRISSSCQMILTNLQRSSELIRDFKGIAVDQSADQLRRFNVYSYMQEVLNSLHHRLKQIPVHVEVQGDTALCIHSYPGVFGQIITNLVLNSVVHAFHDGLYRQADLQACIDIHFRMNETEQLQLIYRDNGCGVADDQLPHLFEPFYTTKRGKGGTGLGLHIVYNLVVQKLKGHISCRSEVGQFIEFEMQLPVSSTERTPALLESQNV